MSWDLGTYGVAKATVYAGVTPKDGITFEVVEASDSTDQVTIQGGPSVAGISNALTYTFYVVPKFVQMRTCYGGYGLTGFSTGVRPDITPDFKVVGCYTPTAWTGDAIYEFIPLEFTQIALGQNLEVTATAGASGDDAHQNAIGQYSCHAYSRIEGFQNVECGCFPSFATVDGVPTYQANVAIDACGNVSSDVPRACPKITDFIVKVGDKGVFMPGGILAEHFAYLVPYLWWDPPTFDSWQFFEGSWDPGTEKVTCTYVRSDRGDQLIFETMFQAEPDYDSGLWDRTNNVCHSSCPWIPQGI